MESKTKDDEIKSDMLDKAYILNNASEKISLDELRKLREFLNYKMLFSPDYTWGYTSALLDMLALIEDEYLNLICRNYKITKNFKTMQKIIKTMIGHRQMLRDRFKNYYLIWDVDKKDFKIGIKKMIMQIVE